MEQLIMIEPYMQEIIYNILLLFCLLPWVLLILLFSICGLMIFFKNYITQRR
jgi:hypothetical protein